MDHVADLHPRISRPVALSLAAVALGAELIMLVSVPAGLMVHGALIVAIAVALTVGPESSQQSRFADPGERPASLVAALIPISMARMAFAVIGTSTWPRGGLVLLVAIVGLASVAVALRVGAVPAAELGFTTEFRALEFVVVALMLPLGILLSRAVPAELAGPADPSLVAVIVAMVAVLLAAFVDEAIYRGVLQGALAPLGPDTAPLLAGVFYGLGFAAMWPGRWVALFVFAGILLGYWREASTSILGPALGATALAIGLYVVGPALGV